MKYPIPVEAFDDRLAILGTSGSGKTYLTLGAIEKLLVAKHRVVAVDPLGVMWGLRLKADGKTASGFNIPIFGGRHGDLPLTEHAGALIGETVATMRESCIVDLSELPTKAAERRFMTAFLDSLYRHTDADKVDPYHLVIDEADRFAPQKPPAGDETMLNRMEEIVRRGRVKGFIPWLITQRPAVLNKNVLSQADGLVMLRLTSSQDRDQVGAWIEGQADRAQGKAILGSLPAMQRGQGVIWIPGRGLLETVQFPTKTTFDSSAAPKRGQKRDLGAALKPLDLGELQKRLATVEAETKANDPAALKRQLSVLNAELAKLRKSPAIISPPSNEAAKNNATALDAAQRKGFDQGVAAAKAAFRGAVLDAQTAIAFANDAAREGLTKLGEVTHTHLRNLSKGIPAASVPAFTPAKPSVSPVPASETKRVTPSVTVASAPRTASGSVRDRVLGALAELEAIGVSPAPRIQAAFLSGYKHDGVPNFRNTAGALRTEGLVEYPDSRSIALTDAGRKEAPAVHHPLSSEELHQKIISLLDGVEGRILPHLIAAYPEAMQRDELAQAASYAHAGVPNFRNSLGRLRSLGFVSYPDVKTAKAQPTLFLEER